MPRRPRPANWVGRRVLVDDPSIKFSSGRVTAYNAAKGTYTVEVGPGIKHCYKSHELDALRRSAGTGPVARKTSGQRSRRSWKRSEGLMDCLRSNANRLADCRRLVSEFHEVASAGDGRSGCIGRMVLARQRKGQHDLEGNRYSIFSHSILCEHLCTQEQGLSAKGGGRRTGAPLQCRCAARAEQHLQREIQRAIKWSAALELLVPPRSSRARLFAAERDPADGWTPLHIAIELTTTVGAELQPGLIRVIRALLRCWPAAVEQRDDDSWLPLHIAASCGPPLAVVEALLDGSHAQATLNTRDICGSLPLDITVSPTSTGSSSDLVRLLLGRYPAAARKRNNFGLLPAHVGSGELGLLCTEAYTKLTGQPIPEQPQAAQGREDTRQAALRVKMEIMMEREGGMDSSRAAEKAAADAREAAQAAEWSRKEEETAQAAAEEEERERVDAEQRAKAERDAGVAARRAAEAEALAAADAAELVEVQGVLHAVADQVAAAQAAIDVAAAAEESRVSFEQQEAVRLAKERDAEEAAAAVAWAQQARLRVRFHIIRNARI